MYRDMQHPGPILVQAYGRNTLGLEVRMILMRLNTHIPGCLAHVCGFFLSLPALFRPFKLFLCNLRPLGFHVFLAQGMAAGDPFDFLAGTEVLHPPGRTFIQESAVCAVQFATIAADERNAVNRTIHDRSFADQVQPGFFQGLCEFFLWRQGMKRLRSLVLVDREPFGQSV